MTPAAAADDAHDAAVNDALAAASAHPTLARLAESLAARPGGRARVDPDESTPRRAAVALVLRVTEAGPELLLVKRAEYPGDPWSGHVAFPGGRRERGDATLWDTAARETWEETGLDLRRHARLLGTLDELYPRTPTLPPIVVRPHVAVAVPHGPLALSDELADAFWVPLARFTEPEVAVTSTVAVRGHPLEVPSYVHDGHVIWGMTHRILEQFLARLG